MLRDPAIIRQEALRLMPKHYKSPMIQSFVGQWLHIDKLQNIMPAPQFKYSDVDTEIARQEVLLSFYEILSKDLPMSTFIDPDFTYSTRGFAYRIYGLGKAPSSNYQSLNNIKLSRMSPTQRFSSQRFTGTISGHAWNCKRCGYASCFARSLGYGKYIGSSYS